MFVVGIDEYRSGAEYMCHHNLRYHVHVVSDDIAIPDAK